LYPKTPKFSRANAKFSSRRTLDPAVNAKILAKNRVAIANLSNYAFKKPKKRLLPKFILILIDFLAKSTI
jgi:hypothetical protein